MFAVIKTGGKQYKVAANDVLKIEKLDVAAGDVVTFDEVLMVGDGDSVTVGAPLVAGARVAAHLVETRKQDTVIIFKKRRRHNSRRRNGHRQLLSTVRISEILIGGAQVTTVPDEKIRAKYAALQAANAAVVTAAEADQQVKQPKAPRTAAPVVDTAPAAAAAPAEAKAPKAVKPATTDTAEAAPKPAKAKAEKPAAEKPAKPAKKAAPKADKE